MPTDAGRRLAAIMFTDIVGSTALTAESEPAGLRAKQRHRTLVRGQVRRYQGELIEAPADETLSLFASALDAVSCALAIQAAVESELDLELHIGIHSGDVLLQAGEVHGDAVNVAARVCSMSEGAGLCVSGEVYKSIRNQPGIAAVSLGERTLRNVPEPVMLYSVTGTAAEPRPSSRVSRPRTVLAVAAVLFFVVGTIAVWLVYDPVNLRGATRTKQAVTGFQNAPAIAVLPFDNLGDDPEDEYFADGISEDLITRLSSSPHYPVIARNSTFVYKGKAVDAKEIGRELDARYIIEGSVRRSRDTVRITAQLIDATTGTHLWAESYDRKLEDVFALQDEIVEEIRKSISPSLDRAEQERALQKDPQSLDAWDLVQRGWSYARKFTREDNRRARAYFQQASELDPRWAAAHAALAWTHHHDIQNQWTGSPDSSLAKLRESSQRAIEADRQSPFAQVMLGTAHMYLGEPQLAIEALESAVRLNPSSIDARQYLGTALTLAGRHQEAIPVLETALRLSSRWDMSDLLSGLALAHYAGGQYEAAVERGRQAIPWAREKAPALAAINYRLLAASYSELGRLEEARAAIQESARLQPDFSLASAQPALFALNPDLAERLLAALRKAGLEE